MLTCGDCGHFEWAKGLTGRKLRKKAGRCGGIEEMRSETQVEVWPIAFTEYYPPAERRITQIRPCYHDSQHASQCAAFEKKVCAPSGKGVYTASIQTTNQEANA